MSGPVGHARRIRGLLQEGDQPVLSAVHGCMHDAEAARLGMRGTLQAADGDVGARLHMLLQHGLVIHLIDVVAGQEDDVLRRVGSR